MKNYVCGVKINVGKRKSSKYNIASLVIVPIDIFFNAFRFIQTHINPDFDVNSTFFDCLNLLVSRVDSHKFSLPNVADSIKIAISSLLTYFLKLQLNVKNLMGKFL